MIKIFFKEHFKNEPLNHIKDEINDEKLTNLSRISFFLTFILIGIKIFTVLIGLGDVFKITYIAVIACLPIVLFSKRRLEIIKNIDYHTLIFFTSMFVLMESVWNTGIFQNIVKDMDLNSTLTTLSLSVI
jgi:Na+/H+ antiporter NhaD/arsenite permease-like protein